MQQVRSGPGPFLPTSLPRPRSRSWSPAASQHPAGRGSQGLRLPSHIRGHFRHGHNLTRPRHRSRVTPPKLHSWGRYSQLGHSSRESPGAGEAWGAGVGTGAEWAVRRSEPQELGFPCRTPLPPRGWQRGAHSPPGLWASRPPHLASPTPPMPFGFFHVQRLGFRAVLGLCQGDTLSV